MRKALDAVAVGEQLARERERGAALPHAGRTVEEVGVRRARRRALRSAAASPRPARAGASKLIAPAASGPPPRSPPAAAPRPRARPAPGSAPPAARRRGRPRPGSRRLPARSGRARPCGGRRRSQHRPRRRSPVGQQALEHGQVELEHEVEPEAARDPLVGERRVDEAVADDVGAARERRPDHLGGMLGARGGEQRRLRPRSHVRPVEDEPAQLLAELRAARFAGRDDLASEPGEVPLEQPRLRRFPRPVHPFERHEHDHLGYDRARVGHRRGRLHRVEPRRRTRRARGRRRRRSTTSARGSART